MAVVVLLIQYSLGAPVHGKRNFVKLAWFFCRKENEREWRAAPLYIFGLLCGNKIKEHLRTKNRLSKIEIFIPL